MREPDSLAMASFYDANSGRSWMSSTLLRVEIVRSAMRIGPAAIDTARGLTRAFSYLGMDDEIIDAASAEPDPMLGFLDAIHLASARLLGDELEGLVTYDRRLATAAADAGMTVISPAD